MKEPSPWITWEESGQPQRAHWRSESQVAPTRLLPVDDTLTANAAHKLVLDGTGLLWRGDFHNARQLLQALARRVDKPARVQPPRGGASAALPTTVRTIFLDHRANQARRATLLNRVLVPVTADHAIALNRAQDVRTALTEAWGDPDGHPSVVSLRELQGLVGAHEWRKKGVDVPVLGGRIHPHYGVFSPVRGEYLPLIADAPLPAAALSRESLAFDIGTGTGVIAALLARRGVRRVVATDLDPRAIACAGANVARLGLASHVELERVDMFPAGRAALVVCNPPWVPTPANAAIERAVYDPDSAMLRAFLAGVAAHLADGGEAWLIMSDLAEHLDLRTRAEMLAWIADGRLRVIARHDTRPTHRKAGDPGDPLFAARAKETTSLWRLGTA